MISLRIIFLKRLEIRGLRIEKIHVRCLFQKAGIRKKYRQVENEELIMANLDP